MTDANTDLEARDKLWDLIKDIRIAMMTTQDDDVLRARPMQGYQDSFDGTLWFFSRLSSHKRLEIEREHQVCLAYADPDHQRYVSVSGVASLEKDKARAKALWNKYAAAWFPEGLDDPDLVLIRVRTEQAEYWDSAASRAVQLYRVAKARLTGERPYGGENEKLDLTGTG